MATPSIFRTTAALLALAAVPCFAVTPGMSRAKSDPRAGPAFQSREERAAWLRFHEELTGGMYDDGKPKMSFESGGFGPSAPMSSAPADTPSAPGSSMNFEKLSKFLRLGLSQVGGQSYSKATETLRTTIESVYKVGGLPRGIDLCFRYSRKVADKASNWEKAYKATAATLRAVADDPHRYTGEGPDFARNFLALARGFCGGASYQEAVWILDGSVQELESSGLFSYQEMDRVILKSTRHGAKKVSSWEKAWKIWLVSWPAVAEQMGQTSVPEFYRLALRFGGGISYQEATTIIWESLRNLIRAGAVDPFDKVTIETAIEQGRDASTWKKAYAQIKNALDSLS